MKATKAIHSTQARAVKILINGEPAEIEQSLSVAQLLELRQFTQKHLAVELNGEVVPRAQHAETLVHDGDQLEVVSLVGGG